MSREQLPNPQNPEKPGVVDPEPVVQKKLDPVTERMKEERSDPTDISGPPLDKQGRPIRL